MGSEGRIEAIVGEIGSGKSLVATAKWVLPHLAQGGVVATNLALRLYPWSSLGYRKSYRGLIQTLEEDYDWVLQEGQLIVLGSDDYDRFFEKIPECRGGLPVRVVFDEALEGYDSLDRNENSGRLRDVLSFYRHARHFGVELCLLLQTFGELNNRIRSKMTHIYFCADTNKMRVPVVRIPWPIRNCILFQQRDKRGVAILREEYVPKIPRYYGCYETDDVSTVRVRCGGGSAVDYRGKGKVKRTMKKHEKVLLYLLALVQLWVVGAVLWRRPVAAVAPVVQSAGSVQAVGEDAKESGDMSVVKVPFQSNVKLGGRRVIYADGLRYVKGEYTNGDLCVEMSSDKIWLKRGSKLVCLVDGSGEDGQIKKTL